MCRTWCVAKTVSIGYITSTAVQGIRVLNRGMRQTVVLTEKERASDMDIVKMERNCLGDTRTATHMPTREEFRESNWSHKDDVLNLAVAFATELRSRVGNHDWTKVQAPYDEMFYELMKATIEDGADFMDGEWARLHYDVLERHHLSRHCPSDVTLFDVLEMLFDCVSAGMTRSGSVYPIEISNEILQKAVSNTVDYLVKHVEVADRKTENSSENPNNSTSSKMEQVEDEFKQFDREDLILLIECQKERIAELLADKDTPQTDSEITRNSLRTDCTGCKFVGWYDTDFPCVNCIRKNKDCYTSEQTEREGE